MISKPGQTVPNRIVREPRNGKGADEPRLDHPRGKGLAVQLTEG
jgi:hypothetical protein